MIDLLSIFSSGGIVLFSSKYDNVPDNIVNSLISTLFIENQKLQTSNGFQKDGFTVKYTVSNDLGMTFVVVFKTILQLSYVDSLLQDCKKIFISLFEDVIRENIKNGEPISSGIDFSKFEALIGVRLKELEGVGEASGDRDISEITENTDNLTISSTSTHPSTNLDNTNSSSSNDTTTTDRPLTPKPKGRRGGKKSSNTTPSNTSPNLSGAEDSGKPLTPKPKKKLRRRWDESGMAEYDDDDDVVLDYSSSKGTSSSIDTDNVLEYTGDLTNYGSSTKSGEFVLKELSNELRDILESEDSGSGDGTTSSKTADANTSFGFLRNFIGGKTITKDDLDKALIAMEDHLMKKNVAKEVATHLCNTVDKSLVGSKTQNWTTVEATVRTSMTDALRRILTPNTSLDLLHEVQAARKARKRPYVISVVGVNGVGKSTNLSKIGFWLLQNKYKVLIAACDTFRSGAVEQLKVHVRRLQELTQRLGTGEVQIFDEGYGKDAAVIAQRAIEFGERNNFDVVLIDTAGRRHNDDRLMSSLEKFGQLANPDKIIMVGEALVGTDSVQQARNFNAAFGTKRNLDFFLISKCDTVGDMIGSMVNMTYSTGIPVLFVGVGQNYTDLRTLSIDWAVNLLMS